ncbi:MAG: hypothetical protein JXO22_15420, partial [Phycisphaerae bacterium]|nr:hypothetical protein [Phycisphaerae bacterium]
MPFQNRPSRREVLRWGAVAASGAMLGRAGLPALAADESKPATKLPTRKLGKNGPEICALMYGGGSIARSKEFD